MTQLPSHPSLQVHHSLLHFYNNCQIILDHPQLSVTLISRSGPVFSFNIAHKACFDCGHHGVKNTLCQVRSLQSSPDLMLTLNLSNPLPLMKHLFQQLMPHICSCSEGTATVELRKEQPSVISPPFIVLDHF